MPQTISPLRAAMEVSLIQAGARDVADCKCTQRLRHHNVGMISKSHIELAAQMDRIGTPEALSFAARLRRGDVVEMGDWAAGHIAAVIASI